MNEYTLIYPIDRVQSTVLYKKDILTGKWAGLFNGFGGKREEGELFSECAIRELNEECGSRVPGLYISPSKLNHRAELTFQQIDKTWGPNTVHVYTCDWQQYDENGKENIPESKWNEEAEKWETVYTEFSIFQLPYTELPPADIHWLPYIFHTDLYYRFIFTYNGNLLEKIDIPLQRPLETLQRFPEKR